MGTPLIITGQIALVLLDQRDVLVEIRDELKDHGPPSAADRFLTRKAR